MKWTQLFQIICILFLLYSPYVYAADAPVDPPVKILSTPSLNNQCVQTVWRSSERMVPMYTASIAATLHSYFLSYRHEDDQSGKELVNTLLHKHMEFCSTEDERIIIRALLQAMMVKEFHSTPEYLAVFQTLNRQIVHKAIRSELKEHSASGYIDRLQNLLRLLE